MLSKVCNSSILSIRPSPEKFCRADDHTHKKSEPAKAYQNEGCRTGQLSVMGIVLPIGKGVIIRRNLGVIVTLWGDRKVGAEKRDMESLAPLCQGLREKLIAPVINHSIVIE